MSQPWLPDRDGSWRHHLLDANAVALTPLGPVPVAAGQRPGAGPVLLRADHSGGVERWLLVCAPEDHRTRVNGAPVSMLRAWDHEYLRSLDSGAESR